ncbi:hypothetical protein Tco_0763939, partial [Tanacetum coccineum]
ESPGYIADSDSMEEDTDADSIDYPNDLEDGEEDDDKDPEEDPSEEHDPEDDDDDDEDEEPTENKEEEEHPAPTDSSAVPVIDPVPSARDTEAFETDESAPTPRSPQTRVPFSQTHLCRAWKTVRLELPISASMEARIAEHAAAPIPPTSPTYDQAPLGHRAARIRMRDDIPEEDMPPRRRFVLTTPPPRCDVAESSAAAARPPRGRYDFVDTVRKQESEDFYTQLHDAQTDRRDIRLEIDVVRGQRTAYETELHEQRQRAKDDAVRQMMHTHVLEARAQIDTVEDTGNSCGGPRRPVQPARVCSYTDFMKCQPLNFKGTEGIVGLFMIERLESVISHLRFVTIDNSSEVLLNLQLLGSALPGRRSCEIKKLEIELVRIFRVRGNDVAALLSIFPGTRTQNLDEAIEVAKIEWIRNYALMRKDIITTKEG